jgi:hypothetical protein
MTAFDGFVALYAGETRTVRGTEPMTGTRTKAERRRESVTVHGNGIVTKTGTETVTGSVRKSVVAGATRTVTGSVTGSGIRIETGAPMTVDHPDVAGCKQRPCYL